MKMKKIYFFGIIIMVIMILILSLPQIGATCTWLPPIGGETLPMVALLQAAGLGAILGGVGMLYWKSLREPLIEEDDIPDRPTGTSMEKENTEDK